MKLSKAEQWLDAPIPHVDSSGLHLEAGPSEARQYFQTMYDLIYLAFLSDSTRVATFQLGRENGGGPHDMLSKAVDLGGAHGLTHAVKRRTDGRILEHITAIRLKNSGDLLVNLEIPLSQVGTETCLIILSPCMGLLPVAFISHEITPSSPPEEKT